MSYYGPSDRLYRAIAAMREHEDRMRRILAIDVRYGCGGEHATHDDAESAAAAGHPYRPPFVEVPGVNAARSPWVPEPPRQLKPWQAALGACGVDGVEAWEDRDSHSTVLTQLCAWCGRRVSTRLDDTAICAAPSQPHVVTIAITALDRARHKHLAARRCATASHDPGDEDPGEDAARLMWRPTP